jgi:HAD superfamily (subfamily IA) hydrolase, TIGR02254
MKYTTLLFDADNTLFDFDAAEASSLRAVCKTLGIEMDRQIFNLYHHINKKCWADFEKGKLPQEEIQFTRFSRFLNRLESDADPIEVGNQYLSGLAKSETLIEGALEMLKRLKSMNFELVVITNGLKQVQRAHFEQTGLTKYFSEIIVSDEIGVSKPHKPFFDYTFEKIKQKDKSKVLIIGDGLSSDIKGGMNYGVDTLWFNKKRIELPKGFKPTYRMDRLEDIFGILNLF